jgi:hypothetical protein
MNMIVSAAALTAGSKAIASVQPNDSVLLEMEEKIFEHRAAAQAYDDEILRLDAIWKPESLRLLHESLAGRSALTRDEQWALVEAMPECKEQRRLEGLQEVHWTEFDRLIEEMWATPAHTPEGRRAKVLVLLGAILGDDRRRGDWHCEYETKRARSLLIEFVGGEPAKQLRDQFAA